MQECNARKVNCGCVHIETSSLWAEFVNNNRYISVRSVFEEGGSMENLSLLSTVCENIKKNIKH